MKDGIQRKPNKKEIILLDIIENIFHGEYEYIGDFDLWIGTKNSDFICIKSNKIIELFGNYWHSEKITGISEKVHEKERIEYFKKHGYETLIIWENELENIEKLNRKIIEFHKGE